MKDNFWVKVDAYLFRIFGIVIGSGVCAGLLLNNPLGKVLHSPYGVIIFIMFGFMAAYSLLSLGSDLFTSSGGE